MKGFEGVEQGTKCPQPIHPTHGKVTLVVFEAYSFDWLVQKGGLAVDGPDLLSNHI